MELFRIGGWGMYPTLVFGVLMTLAAVVYAVRPERRFVPLQVTLGIMTLASGALGFVAGLIATFTHVGEVGPDHRWIVLVGLGESLPNLALAFALVVIAALAASLGALRIAREPRWAKS